MAGRAQISGTELKRLLDLVRDADSVELKLTLPENARAGTGAALGADPLDAQIRQVFFFDTPDLALNAAGVVVRARRRQGEEADTVVKLRPVVPAELPKELRRSKMFNVEVDAMPGGFVCSASLKGTADNSEIREVAGGERPDPQALLEGPAGVLCHPRARRTRARPALRPRADPDPQAEDQTEGIRAPARGGAVAVSGRLSDRRALHEGPALRSHARSPPRRERSSPSIGVDLEGKQQTKTKTALEFFAGAVQSENGHGS